MRPIAHQRKPLNWGFLFYWDAMLDKSKNKRYCDKPKDPKPQPTRKELRRQLGWELAEAQRNRVIR